LTLENGQKDFIDDPLAKLEDYISSDSFKVAGDLYRFVSVFSFG